MTTSQPMEVKKDGLRQMQDGTWNLTVKVHPNDMPTSLMAAPMGTRYGMALVEIGDDEKPVAAPEPRTERKPATTRAEKARRLCGVVAFQDWMRDRNGAQSWPPEWHSEPARYQQVSFWVKQTCGVKSKNDIVYGNPTAIANWNALLAEYEQSTGRMAEKH